MLLKRVEKENVVKAIYDSSNILASKYEKNNKNLTITFKRGVQYVYKNVSQTDYVRFETSESQGSILNSHIKSYDVEKGESVHPDSIVEEINKIKKEDIIKRQELIISDMESIISNFDINQDFNEKKLLDLTNKITNYFNNTNE
jgi:hypothetical protein